MSLEFDFDFGSEPPPIRTVATSAFEIAHEASKFELGTSMFEAGNGFFDHLTRDHLETLQSL